MDHAPMTMMIIHVVALYLIVLAIVAVAVVIWQKNVSVTVQAPPPAHITVHPTPAVVPNIVVHPPAAPAPHIVVTPAPVHQVWQTGGTIGTAQPPEMLVELLKDGKHLGWRHAEHPDIEEAIATRGLSVRLPDGTIVGAE